MQEMVYCVLTFFQGPPVVLSAIADYFLARKWAEEFSLGDSGPLFYRKKGAYRSPCKLKHAD